MNVETVKLFETLLDPGFRRNPHPTYHRLRAEGAVHPTDIGLTMVLSHAGCETVLKDKRFITDRDVTVPALNALRERRFFRQFLSSVLMMNPPDHTRLRNLVSRAFSPRAIASLEDPIRDFVAARLDAAAGADDFDFVADLALPLPLHVICKLLGIPSSDEAEVRSWSNELALVVDPSSALDPAQLQRADLAALQFRPYIDAIVADRAVNPRDDLISVFVEAAHDGDRLDDEEVFVNSVLLLIAGHDTTANLIGNGIGAFMENPEQWELLRTAPAELAPNAVEEAFRFVGPTTTVGRAVAEPVVIEGVTLEKDAVVLGVVSAANRDPKVFADPDVFDIKRENARRHLGLGEGIHYCIGAALARLEARIVFEEMATRFGSIEPVIPLDEAPLRQSALLRGFESLPLRLVA